MRRRAFTALLGGATSAWPLAVRAQQSALPVIGWLNLQPLTNSQVSLEGFRKGLGEVGFEEGRNVRIEFRPADNRHERLPELADELVRRGVAVIMAGGPPAALAAARTTRSIPIVFTSGADPVSMGLVPSYNRPGGNVTGIHVQFIELTGKRLALLRETVPQAVRIAVLVNPANPSEAAAAVQNATEAARALGIVVQAFNARTVDEIDAAFAALLAWRADAVLVGSDPFLSTQAAQIATWAVRHQLPTSGHSRGFVEAGGLMTYGPDGPDSYRLAGRQVGRILNGEKPADLPVQQPTKFELIINLRTAKALGVTVPQSLLLQTDDLLE